MESSVKSISVTNPQLSSALMVFEKMAMPDPGDPVELISELFGAIRPNGRAQLESASETWGGMIQLLEERTDWREAVASTMLHLFSDREQKRFYTEAGLLPNSGFFSELRRKLAHKLLPELTNPMDLKDCIHLIFSHPKDQQWMEMIPSSERARFWEIIGREPARDRDAELRMRGQLIESVLILAHRIAAMGLEPELCRVMPRLSYGESPFVALAEEVSRFVTLLRGGKAACSCEADDESHLLVLLDQCQEVVKRVHQAAASHGTSMGLTFLIVRLRQHLDRLYLLVRLLSVRTVKANRSEINERWSDFFLDAIAGERQRNSIKKHFSDLLVLLSLRVTENAGKAGEHYIASSRAEWLGIGRAAAGAGVFIAIMALMKLRGYYLHLPLFSQGVMNGLIYGVGFAVIHMFHFIVATKQPAMTAATIAATVSQTRGRLKDVERLADLVVATVRSQVAAIAGNVLVAFPVALLIALTAYQFSGGQLMGRVKAETLLSELNPLGGTLVYAAIAGVWLFTAGLVSGYVDNVVAYSRTGDRVAGHPLLVRLLGVCATARLGAYLDRNAGGLAGNLFFGMMLGLTPAFGQAFGLPVDIRHIAFSSANLGYLLVAKNFGIETMQLLIAVAGVFLIGGVNLLVSFCLALFVALRSRGVELASASGLLSVLARRLKERPLSFFFPAS